MNEEYEKQQSQILKLFQPQINSTAEIPRFIVCATKETPTSTLRWRYQGADADGAQKPRGQMTVNKVHNQ